MVVCSIYATLKQKINQKLSGLALPLGIVCVEGKAGGNRSLVTRCGVMSVSPPLIYISLSKTSQIKKIILEKGEFTYHTVSAASTKGLWFDAAGDIKLSASDGYYADSDSTIDEDSLEDSLIDSPIRLTCRISETYSVYGAEIIVGKVEKTIVGRRYLREGQRNPCLKRVDPVICTSEKECFSSGGFISDAFSIGYCHGSKPHGVFKHYFKSLAKRFLLNCYSKAQFLKTFLKKGIETSLNQVQISSRSLIYPLPAAIFGSCPNGSPNFSVVANFGVLSVNPPVVYVSSSRSHYTNIGVRQNHCFSINIPNSKLVVKTDYCGLFSGNRVSKATVFETFFGENQNAPLIHECPVNIALNLITVKKAGSMDVFIGEVAETYVNKTCLNNNGVDIGKVDPIIYALNRKYWRLGKKIGRIHP